MADVIVFHHAQGLTPGVLAFADELRAAGHQVTVPDLYDGATFPTTEEGVAHAQHIGQDVIIERGVQAAADLPAAAVYAGFSLGVLPAQKLAQTRLGALGALLYHDGLPASVFGSAWPERAALQVHISDPDPWSDPEGARELVKSAADGELHVYPSLAHLFTDASLPDYDESAARLVLERSKAFLTRWS